MCLYKPPAWQIALPFPLIVFWVNRYLCVQCAPVLRAANRHFKKTNTSPRLTRSQPVDLEKGRSSRECGRYRADRDKCRTRPFELPSHAERGNDTKIVTHKLLRRTHRGHVRPSARRARPDSPCPCLTLYDFKSFVLYRARSKKKRQGFVVACVLWRSKLSSASAETVNTRTSSAS